MPRVLIKEKKVLVKLAPKNQKRGRPREEEDKIIILFFYFL